MLGARTSAPTPQSQPSTAFTSDSARPFIADHPFHSAFAERSSPERPPNTPPKPKRLGAFALLSAVSLRNEWSAPPAFPDTPRERLGSGRHEIPPLTECPL